MVPLSHFLLIRENSNVGTNNPLTPPPGYTKLGINGATRGPEVTISSGITIVAAFIAVVARLCAKFFVSKKPGWEDLFCVLAFFFALARVVTNFILVDWYQMGYHIWDLDLEYFEPSLVVYKVGYLLYLPAILFVKLSLIFLYLRIFHIKRAIPWICYSLMVLVLGYTVSLWFAELFQCSPFAAGWSFEVQGHCASLTQIDYAMGGFNIFTDAALLILPMPYVVTLHAPFKRILALLTVFSAGALVLAIAIVRQVLVVQTLNTYDTNWSSVEDLKWLTVEVNVGIICSCLPLIPPLFKDSYLQKQIMKGSYSLKSLLTSRRGSPCQVSGPPDVDSDQIRPLSGTSDEIVAKLQRREGVKTTTVTSVCGALAGEKAEDHPASKANEIGLRRTIETSAERV